MTSTKKTLRSILQPFTSITWSPTSLLVITIFTAALYTTMEWVFIFTRPSFLQTVSFLEKTQALAAASGLLVLACLLLLSPFLLLGWLIKKAAFRKALTAIAYLLPAFLLSALALLMLDNFTYTVFHFGIISTSGLSRALYGVAFTLLFFFIFLKLLDFHNLVAIFFSRWKSSRRFLLIAGLLLISFAGAALPAEPILNSSLGISRHRPTPNSATPPDILLITVDGVNAEYTSLDDSTLATTPFLQKLAGESLNARNAFSNAQGTIGSLTAILTGKYPVDTRVIYSSDMLQEEDAYQHLPDILEDYGYYTAQLSNAVYADAYKTNFQDAFEEANGRSAEQDPVMFLLARLYPGIDHLFQQEVIERLSTRLGHIYFVNDMANPYMQVTEAPQKFDDRQKLAHLYTLLEESRQPVFVHLHWMGTHGPNYFPEEQVFSAGLSLENQQEKRQLFYLDAILDFDRALAEIYAYLEDNDLLENTLLVVTSDHSQKWTNSRIPLLMRFPGADHAGVLTRNVQTIDIAPTLLDYIGIETPGWMAGQSLISPGYETRPVFIAKIPKSSKDPVTGKVIYPESEPPFYQFGRMSVIVCDQWFELDLQEFTLKQGVVKEYPSGCTSSIGKPEALALLMDHLERYGFNTSSLEALRTTLN